MPGSSKIVLVKSLTLFVILVLFDSSRLSLFILSLQRRVVDFALLLMLDVFLQRRGFSELASTDVFNLAS